MRASTPSWRREPTPCATLFVVGLDELDSSQGQRVEELRLLYVAMTRATHRLSLSAMGTSAIVDHVEQSLERVKRAYH
jgi:superfamily I DNA/RNA helicase